MSCPYVQQEYPPSLELYDVPVLWRCRQGARFVSSVSSRPAMTRLLPTRPRAPDRRVDHCRGAQSQAAGLISRLINGDGAPA